MRWTTSSCSCAAGLSAHKSMRVSSGGRIALPTAIVALLFSAGEASGQPLDSDALNASSARSVEMAMSAGEKGRSRSPGKAPKAASSRLQPGVPEEDAPKPCIKVRRVHDCAFADAVRLSSNDVPLLPNDNDRVHQHVVDDDAYRNVRSPFLGGWSTLEDGLRYKFRGPVIVVQRSF